MKASSYFAIIVGLIATFVASQAILVAMVDPFGQFEGRPKTWWHHWDSRWRTPSLIRGNPGVTLVTVGSSMSEGFQPQMFGVADEEFLNIAFPGATIEEEATAVRFLLQHARPKIIVWELHPGAFIRGERLGDATNLLPGHLYGDTITGTLRYLLSPASIIEVRDYLSRLNSDSKINADSIVTWPTEVKRFSPEAAVRSACYSRQPKKLYFRDDPVYREKLNAYAIPLVAANPDVEFRFFTPAFPDVWYWRLGTEGLEGITDNFISMSDTLSRHRNVRFLAMMDAPFMADWSHYRDAVHYDAAGSAWQATRIITNGSDNAVTIAAKAATIRESFSLVDQRLARLAPTGCPEGNQP